MIKIPLGIALIEWDDHYGATLRSMHPKNLNLNNDIALQLYTSQTMGDISVPRFSVFQTNEIRVAGYFGGEKDNSLIVIVLDENDEPEKYKFFLIHSFNKYLSNNSNIDEFLKNSFEDLLLLEDNLKKEFILNNKKIQNFFFNVIEEEIKIIESEFDPKLGLYYPKLIKLLDISPNESEIFLDFLIKQKFLISEILNNVFTCPECDSIKIIFKIQCPDCFSTKIEKNATIQHDYCGYVDFYKNFYDTTKNQLICPNCNTIITHDFGIKNKGIFYKCLEKGTFFKKGKEIFYCINCNKKFEKDKLKFKSISSYKVNLEKINQVLNFKKE